MAWQAFSGPITEDPNMHRSHRLSPRHGRQARAIAVTATQDTNRRLMAGLLLLVTAWSLIALLG